MRIVVPTRGRVGAQVTLAGLPPALRAITTVVCPSKEVSRLASLFPSVYVKSQPRDDMTIAKKREWILRDYGGEDKLVMLDDDLRFCVREKPGGSAEIARVPAAMALSHSEYSALEQVKAATKLRQAHAEDTEHWFSELEKQLSAETPHAGFGPRGGNNQRNDWSDSYASGWQRPGRMMYVLGYHVPTVLAHCKLGRIETREDMDLSLQLLRLGFPNAVNHTFVVDQVYAKHGGCTGERTVERSNDDARRLAEFHPGLVRVVEKKYLASVPRLEVVCQWARALQEGKQRRAADRGRAQGGAGRRRGG
jgi:hypothetical protein